jgi:uncharacterized membrane protein YdjX (TVP38/TMEM64 family)
MFHGIVYFIMCVLQPICLPIPEVITIVFGVGVLGPMLSILLGVSGSLLGISIMFFVAKLGGDTVRRKYASQKHLNRYQRYIEHNAVVITGFLFVIPVLPDEIVCIGAAAANIPYRKLILIAMIFKTLSITTIAFSDQIAVLLGTSKAGIIFIEVCLVFILAYIMRKRDISQQVNVTI